MKTIEVIEEETRKRNDAINKAILSGDSLVQKFYNNAVVFITGGSGFVGKQLIEKLIRSTNVKKIYILLRVKKEKTIQERLEAVLKDPIFQELHEEGADFVDKLGLIEGDTCKDNLGISEKNWTMLTEEVDIILHAAASVSFSETLKSAAFTNIKGPREILRLAKACKHLKSVVHVSTAYSHATVSRTKDDIKEDFYKCPIRPEILLEFAENMDEETLNTMMKPVMKEWPNSYTFTKAVAEELVRVMGEGLPICIVRPAIVISAYREPTLGWVDVKNTYGPSGLILGVALGVLHALNANDNINFDIVPVDIVSNAILIAAREAHDKYREGNRETVIYTVSGKRNPIIWKDFVDTVEHYSIKLIPNKALWYCYAISTQNKYIYLFLSMIFHCIPGMMIDGFCFLIGRKPRLTKVYNLASSLSSVLAYFMNNDWILHDSNTLNLYDKLSDTDKLIYNCDMGSVDRKESAFIWFYGVIKYIIKDDMKNRSYALRKQSVLRIVNYIVLPLYLYGLFKLSWAFITFIYFFVHMFVKFCCCKL